MTEYVLTERSVKNSLRRLQEQSIHPAFSGYLCLQQQASIAQTRNDLSFPFQDFFDQYFGVDTGEVDRPYYIPFSSSQTEENGRWLRRGPDVTIPHLFRHPSSPLMDVASVDQVKGGHSWSLIRKHWKSAQAALCDGTRVPVESLAAFCFRDYGLTLNEPSAFGLVDTFAEEFGYSLGDEAFSTLYRTGDSDITESSFITHD